MDRSWVLSLVLLSILFVSDASSFLESRDEKDTSNSTTNQNPPLHIDTPIESVKSNVSSSQPPLPTSATPKEPSSVSPPPPLQPETEKNGTSTVPISPPPDSQAKMAPPPKIPDKVDDTKGSSEPASTETCVGKSMICRTDNSLVACSISIDKVSGKWLILVQNEGEESLKANILLPLTPLRELTLPKHQSQRVNISISSDTNKIILDTGNGLCALRMYPPEENTLSIHLPSYEKLVTPINGAYFLIVSIVVFGGTWGFCLCRKNLHAGNGVPYRELELSGGSGLENESGVHDVETADWDEGWDDDWDENNAVKSPGGAANSVSISANGLTVRAPSRDGWDHDWDD